MVVNIKIVLRGIKSEILNGFEYFFRVKKKFRH